MIPLILLLATLAHGQASTDTIAVPLLDSIQISNLGKDTRSILSGRYTQTGKPTFQGGFCFKDGTCQTTAPAGGGAGLASTQTFSGGNTFVSSVTINTLSVYSATATQTGILVNGWNMVAISSFSSAGSQYFYGLSSSETYRYDCNMVLGSASYINITVNDDSGASSYHQGGAAQVEGVGPSNCMTAGTGGTSQFSPMCANPTAVAGGTAKIYGEFATGYGKPKVVHLSAYSGYDEASDPRYVGGWMNGRYTGSANLSNIKIWVNSGTMTGRCWLMQLRTSLQ